VFDSKRRSQETKGTSTSSSRIRDCIGRLFDEVMALLGVSESSTALCSAASPAVSVSESESESGKMAEMSSSKAKRLST